ncbi:XkdQ/YqbQ family protein [Brevibacillus thermoruber]|jgi:ribosomal protein L20A (L18A)|uniref:XkdQ/YqbQ family protein n=1 Tax=Brevibacillus thermoruber TaxID=33942 RepID=UPI00404385F3
MAHQLILIKDGVRRNITELVGNVSWSSNIDALGIELSFDFAYNDTQYFKGYDIVDVGDQIVLMNDSNILHYFIVVKSSQNGRFGKSFTCFDRAWYLNKNETVIQFRDANATQAIEKLLNRFAIKHRIAKMDTKITQIYKDQVVSDIIFDILQQVEQETGIKYRMEIDTDTVVISKQTDLIIKPMIRLSENNSPFPISVTISNPSREKSIEELKNKVIVVADGEENIKIIEEKQDQSSINKYGLLTEVVTVDQKDESQARNIATNTLKQLNRIGETISCEMLGHDDVRAGRIIEVNEPITGIVGKYLIKSAQHTLNNGIHKVSVELEVVI